MDIPLCPRRFIGSLYYTLDLYRIGQRYFHRCAYQDGGTEGFDLLGVEISHLQFRHKGHSIHAALALIVGLVFFGKQNLKPTSLFLPDGALREHAPTRPVDFEAATGSFVRDVEVGLHGTERTIPGSEEDRSRVFHLIGKGIRP